jgi:hypothetical protein
LQCLSFVNGILDVQLLIYGPFVDTNFRWSHYTQENVAAAAAILRR